MQYQESEIYKRLFSQKERTRPIVSSQNRQQLFFSIRLTAYFGYLARYYDAPAECDAILGELLRYSGFEEIETPDGMRRDILPPQRRNITVGGMLRIGEKFLINSNFCMEPHWRCIGFYITSMLMIRPFAAYHAYCRKQEDAPAMLPVSFPDGSGRDL